jgi:hypothetical protein
MTQLAGKLVGFANINDATGKAQATHIAGSDIAVAAGLGR